MLKRQPSPYLEVDPLLTEGHVAAWTGRSLRTLARRRKDGSIKAIPWDARRYRYRKSEVERFIRSREENTTVYFGQRREAGETGKEAASEERAAAKSPRPKKDPADTTCGRLR
jgi:helix-turn-helix protein